MDRSDPGFARGTPDGGNQRGLSGKAALVFEEVEKRLIYGTYRFGEAIPTSAIAAEFSISRATMMMVLNQLSFAGYVRIVPQVGSQVIVPSRRQVRDYFRMFSLIERQMAEFAAARRSPEALRDIEEMCAGLSAGPNDMAGPTPDYIDLIDLYHIAIRRAADSPLEVARTSHYSRFAAFLLVNGRTVSFDRVVEQSNRDRPLVTRAIRDGDVQAAGTAMQAYVLAGLPAGD